ncbi:MAG: NFACT family protein, partial [Candidatus Micrarchaeota archaeon]|nr:NFACT family protein [Candidatus Micrarchaeota archaeon]
LFVRDSEKTEAESTPFASSIKNMIMNRILRKIRQINNDRILELEFDDASLILECTKKGNVVLLSEGKIKSIKEKITEKERNLDIGFDYVPPKNEKKETNKEEIMKILNQKEMQDEKVVVAITRNISFPAFYLNKILELEGIDPKKRINDLKEDEKEIIAERMEKFCLNLINFKVRPILIGEEAILADEAMIAKIKPIKEIKFSEYFANSYREKNKKIYEFEKEKRIEKLMERLRHQEERKIILQKQIDEEREKGEWIIKHAYEITQILEEYSELKKKGDKEEMGQFLKRNNLELTKDGIKINVKSEKEGKNQ